MKTQSHPIDQQVVAAWFCLGLGVGLLLASAVAWQWLDSGKGTRVSVLGSGKYVSVLITHEHRRILIASGSNAAAFSNSVSKALPPIGDAIDVLLIDPRASVDVVDRARSLQVKTVIWLPDRENHNESSTAQRSFVVDLGDGVSISIRIRPSWTWDAMIETRVGRISITPGNEIRALSAAIHISLDEAELENSAMRSAMEIGPTVNHPGGTSLRASVSGGTVLTITIADSGFQIPRSNVERGESDQRANQIPRINRNAAIELRSNLRA